MQNSKIFTLIREGQREHTTKTAGHVAKIQAKGDE